MGDGVRVCSRGGSIRGHAGFLAFGLHYNLLPRSRTPEEALDSSMLFFGGEEEYARDRYWSEVLPTYISILDVNEDEM